MIFLVFIAKVSHLSLMLTWYVSPSFLQLLTYLYLSNCLIYTYIVRSCYSTQSDKIGLLFGFPEHLHLNVFIDMVIFKCYFAICFWSYLSFFSFFSPPSFELIVYFIIPFYLGLLAIALCCYSGCFKLYI